MTTLYDALLEVIPELLRPKDEAKSEVSGFMDLSFDLLKNREGMIVFALSHYYKDPSGDMIADPDMVIVLFRKTKIVKALSYQDSFGYQETDDDNPNGKLQTQLNEFLGQWLKNLKNQGHKIEF